VIIYILKTTLCSALLLMIYFLFLEKENMHRFNRFYLLFTVIISYTIPFITFYQTPEPFPVSETLYFIQDIVSDTIMPGKTQPAASVDYLYIIPQIAYVLIAAFLLIRFVMNISRMVIRAKRYPRIPYHNAYLILVPESIVSHSFFRCIFISKQDYDRGEMRDEILCHELTHVRQMHSIDIIFMEIMLVLVWFNPLLYFYRRAIRLNHEFAADEKVIFSFGNVKSYQLLLINTVNNTKSFGLASQFNFSITKKRLVMMTKDTSLKATLLKQISIIPLLAAAVFIFSEKAIAQQPAKSADKARPANSSKTGKQPPEIVGMDVTIGSTKEGVGPELLKEYENIVNKYKDGEQWTTTFKQRITQQDRDRLEQIYLKMSRTQQLNQHVAFIAPMKPLPRITPTREQFQGWKDSKIYGVWIDNKRVRVDELNDFSNTDFAHVFVSKLSKNAINYGKHYYQVDLMTNDGYKKQYDVAISQKQNILVFRKWKTDVKKTEAQRDY
jgi:bla regulator protein blaR1